MENEGKQVLDLNRAWMGWTEITQRVQGKRLVFFGRGYWFKKAIPYFTGGSCACNDQYIVDNNKYEQGQRESGLDIYSPGKLLQENKDQLFVVITTSGFQEVAKQLIGYGLEPGKHFCIAPHLKNFHSVTNINNCEQIIYFTCSDPLNSGGGLYKLNTLSREYELLIPGVCHGIVAGKDRFFLVNDEVKGIQVLNLQFIPIDYIRLPEKSRPHGIAYCPKRDLLYVSLSGRDSLAIYNLKGEMIREIFLSNKYSKTKLAHHHINDLFVHNDSLFISMFSFSGNWKLGVYDGGILEVDLNNPELMSPVVTNCWMPHNPMVINDSLHYCDSMRGAVRIGTWKTLIEINGFARGLAYDGDFYYVAQSMHRYIDRCPDNVANISLDTGIFVVDKEYKITRFIPIHGMISIHALLIP